jgi:hypothetical protein
METVTDADSIGMPQEPNVPEVTVQFEGTVLAAQWRDWAMKAKSLARNTDVAIHEFASRQRTEGFEVDDFCLRITLPTGQQTAIFGDFSIAGGSFAEFMPVPRTGHVLVGMADHQVVVHCEKDLRVVGLDSQSYFHHWALEGDVVLMKTELSILAFDLVYSRLWEYESPQGAPFSFTVDAKSRLVSTFDDLEQSPMDRFDLVRGPKAAANEQQKP